MRHVAALLIVASVVAAGCGQGAVPIIGAEDSVASPRYVASGLVVESPDHSPALCFAPYVLLGDVPPACSPQSRQARNADRSTPGGSVEIVNWDWEVVDGVESQSGSTWGFYRVVGRYDGESLTLTEPPRSATSSDSADIWTSSDFSTQCEPPPGGWTVVDPATTTNEALDAAAEYIAAQPAYAALWLDQSPNPNPNNDPRKLVVNVRLTDDLDYYETRLREMWGGALCIIPSKHSEAELRSIIEDASDEPGFVRGEDNFVANTVTILVILDVDGELQTRYDDRYGEGVVKIHSALQPAS